MYCVGTHTLGLSLWGCFHPLLLLPIQIASLKEVVFYTPLEA